MVLLPVLDLHAHTGRFAHSTWPLVIDWPTDFFDDHLFPACHFVHIPSGAICHRSFLNDGCGLLALQETPDWVQAADRDLPPVDCLSRPCGPLPRMDFTQL